MIKTRNVPVLLAAAALISLSACSDNSSLFGGNRQASSAGSGGSGSTALAAPAVSSDMIREVQERLKNDGYYRQGNVDGIWGTDTQSALTAFQRDHNLNTTGQLDIPTLLALNVGRQQPAVDRTGTTRGASVPPPPPPQNVAPPNPNLQTTPPPAR
ncbi:MAG: peptidoglycan-binding protein [Acetobacteraceae bacterium]